MIEKPLMIEKFRVAMTLFMGLMIGVSILAPLTQSSIVNIKTTGTPAGWTDDVRITYNETTPDKYPALAVNGNIVNLVWQRATTGAGGHYDIMYKNSTNGGYDWSNAIQLTSGTSGIYCDYPDIAVNNSQIHVVWDDNEAISIGEIKYRSSSDVGITWGPSKFISADDGFNSEMAKIALNNSNIHVVWVDERHGAESVPANTEIYYNRSLNGGITWEGEQRLTNALFASADHDIALNNSNLHLVWEDARTGSFEIYYKMSKDNGGTWQDGQENVGLDRLLTTNATTHMIPRIAVNGSTIHVVWVDVLPGPNYYLYYRNSTDNGFSWNPILLLAGGVNDPNRPDMTIDGNDIHIVWDAPYDDDDIYYINSTDGGGSWSAPLRISVDDTFNSYWPQIEVNGSNRHIIWWDERDGNREIYYKRHPDFPDLSPPSHTNETPPPDSYKDTPGTNVSVHVTDPSGVNDTTIQLYVNGSLVSHTLTPITDGYNVSYISPDFGPGVVECRIVADDNCSNTLDYTWNFTVLATYEIQLLEGWNLISVPYMQVDTAINEVLKDIDGKWDYILWYDASDPADHWKTNATFRPQQLNDLFYLNRSMAFWINITEPNVNLTVRGHISTLTEIPLYAGWNLVGYPTQTTETVANALWGTGADRVEVFNATEPYLIKEVGATYVMKPGEGYWVHMVADSVWVVDW